jgi:hypothetical protein
MPFSQHRDFKHLVAGKGILGEYALGKMVGKEDSGGAGH